MFFLRKKQINFIMYAKKKNPTRSVTKTDQYRSTLQVSHIYQTNEKILTKFSLINLKFKEIIQHPTGELMTKQICISLIVRQNKNKP